MALALGAAGCGQGFDQFNSGRGIGTDLYASAYAPSAIDQAAALDAFIGDTCRAAGLVPVSTSAGGVTCGNGTTDWALFTQAGMNDIDNRCDAYLAWLDDRKRSHKHYFKQITDTAFATGLILNEVGVAAYKMQIVAAAFQLAANSFVNFDSRLLLEVDKSTVQAVVLNGQRRYRLELKGQRIDNKPAAIHALRSYLRICMPFTIETEINNTVTIYERGGAAALERKTPLVSTRTLPGVFLTGGQTQVDAVPLNPDPMKGAITTIEKGMRVDLGLRIQQVLCVESPSDDFGPSGSPFREAIRQFKVGFRGSVTPAQTDTIGPADLTRLLRAEVIRNPSNARPFPPCGDLNPQRIGELTRAMRR